MSRPSSSDSTSSNATSAADDPTVIGDFKKDDVIMSFQEYLNMMGGKATFEGGLAGIESALDFMIGSGENGPTFVGEMCLTMIMKPSKFVLTGKTGNGGGDGVRLDPRLYDFLPKLTEEEIQKMKDDGEHKNLVKARATFPEPLQYLNMTKVRVCGLMYAQLTDVVAGPSLKHFRQLNGGKKPLDFTNDDHFYKSIGGDKAEDIKTNRRNLVLKIKRYLEEKEITGFWGVVSSTLRGGSIQKTSSVEESLGSNESAASNKQNDEEDEDSNRLEESMESNYSTTSATDLNWDDEGEVFRTRSSMKTYGKSSAKGKKKEKKKK